MLELNTGGQKAEVSDRVRLRRLSESGSSFARLAARPASRVVLVFVVQCDSSIETSVRVQPSLCYSSARPACRTVVAVFALDLFWPCSPCSTTTSGCTPCARARHRGLHNYVRCTVLRTPTLRDPPVDHSLACQPASQPASQPPRHSDSIVLANPAATLTSTLYTRDRSQAVLVPHPQGERLSFRPPRNPNLSPGPHQPHPHTPRRRMGTSPAGNSPASFDDSVGPRGTPPLGSPVEEQFPQSPVGAGSGRQAFVMPRMGERDVADESISPTTRVTIMSKSPSPFPPRVVRPSRPRRRPHRSISSNLASTNTLPRPTTTTKPPRSISRPPLLLRRRPLPSRLRPRRTTLRR